MVTTQHEPQQVTIILQPNRSASWQETKLLILFMSAVVFIIAVGWSLVGAWVILPFAGLEAGLLAFFLHKVCLRTYEQQVITIGQQYIKVEAGGKTPQTGGTLPREHTHLAIIEPGHSYDSPKLFLTDDEQRIRVGAFLNKQDCQNAIEQVRGAGIMTCSDQWWRRSV